LFESVAVFTLLQSVFVSFFAFKVLLFSRSPRAAHVSFLTLQLNAKLAKLRRSGTNMLKSQKNAPGGGKERKRNNDDDGGVNDGDIDVLLARIDVDDDDDNNGAGDDNGSNKNKSNEHNNRGNSKNDKNNTSFDGSEGKQKKGAVSNAKTAAKIRAKENAKTANAGFGGGKRKKGKVRLSCLSLFHINSLFLYSFLFFVSASAAENRRMASYD
jgi:hypothetical protein